MEGLNDENSVFSLAYKGDLRILQAKIGQKERYVISIVKFYIFQK